MVGRSSQMVTLSLTRLAAAVGGLALSLIGGGVASADPDLGPVIHMQLLAGGVGAECPDAGRCKSTECVAVGAGRVARIPRFITGSAPSDSRGVAEQATISAVL
jgi:hypothetical protein